MLKSLRPLLADRRRARALAAASVTLAAAGIVLLRAPGPSTAAPVSIPTNNSTVVMNRSPQGAASARFTLPKLHGRIALAQGAVAPDGPQHVYAEVRVTADEARGALPPRPVAMAVVLDVSGSMDGEKIEQARRSVLSLVDQMRDDDRVALVTYSDTARVVQPLTRVADARQRLHMIVPNIGIEGGTNIPAGLQAGASALEFAPSSLVRRVVLVSDGQDTSGQPLERTATAVRTRADTGVTLSALGVGVGYDERFMSRMADAGRGNYEFLRDGAQLRAFLARELEQASRTTVERAFAEVVLPQGWRLARAYGTEAEVRDRVVRLPVGALFAGDARRLVLDLEVDPREAQAAHGAGRAGALIARVGYSDIAAQVDPVASVGALALGVAGGRAEADATRDSAVFAEAEGTVIAARQADAVAAWRSGDAARATAIAQQNVAALNRLQAAAPSAARAAQIRAYDRDEAAFGSLSAASESGRAYGLQTNAVHRRALRSATAY